MWGKSKDSSNSSGKRKAKRKLRAAICVKQVVLGSIFLLLLFWMVTTFKNEDSNEEVDLSHLPAVHFQSHKVANNAPSDFFDAWYCDVLCPTGQPCEYKDEVDFRIIVMTFDRAKSLEKCLGAVSHLDTLGDKVSVEIWVDRSKNGTIDKETMNTAEKFVDKWSKQDRKGRACIHRQDRNAYIGGQWIDTWRPKENTRELGLILEDDVSISPHAYR